MPRVRRARGEGAVRRLRREVISPDGPSRRELVADYRQLRLAVERVERLVDDLLAAAEYADDVDPLQVIDELHPLIVRVRKLL